MKSNWISANERLPEYKQEVLVWMNGKRNPELKIDFWVPRISIGQRLRTDENGEVWYTTWGQGSQEGHVVTHWQPLPEAPQ